MKKLILLSAALMLGGMLSAQTPTQQGYQESRFR